MHKIETTFLKHLPEESGTKKDGNTWFKNTFVCEDGGKYPVQMAFEIWGEKTNTVKNLKPGDKITVHFDIESREYNGRYFTSAKAKTVEMTKPEQKPSAGANTPEQSAQQSVPVNAPVEDDGFPF